MWDGKKSTAQRVFYDALDIIKEKMPDVEPIDVFTQARRERQAGHRGPLASASAAPPTRCRCR